MKLLDELTPEYASKAAYRTERLLPTTQEGVGYADSLINLGEGWAFIIGPYFLDALDTKLTERINTVTNKKEQVWTQGSNFEFPVGYTLHSAPGYPQCALQVQVSVAAEASTYKYTKYKTEPLDLPTGDEDGGLRVSKKFRPRASEWKWESVVQTRRKSGYIAVNIYEPATDRPWQLHQAISTTQDDLVRMLITGELE